MTMTFQPGNGVSGPPAPPPQATPIEATTFWPEPPQTIEEAGLIAPFVEDHLIRLVYFNQHATGSELAAQCGVPYVAIQPLIRTLVQDHVFETVGTKSLVEAGYRYVLAPKGRERADEALKRTWYRGPLPVPLDLYVEAINAQTIRDLVIRRDALRSAFSDLVISEDFLDRIGPAVNAATSIFMYGAPGNGKTAVAERITAMIGGAIFIPRAIEVDGSIVMLFDELNHRPIDAPEGRRYDGRWQRIRRPVVIAGGELTLASLDLIWNDIGKYYEAPLQMKATGGSFLIDDFGRQLVSPRELLNRWIVPLEKRVDYLTLRTGTKVEVPFDELILFSTNIDPKDLVDEAFLRRIRFKVPVPNPTPDQFRRIFAALCERARIPYDEDAIEYLLTTLYPRLGVEPRSVHPRDLIEQIYAAALFEGTTPQITRDSLERASERYFVAL
jgi:hypothetical protein